MIRIQSSLAVVAALGATLLGFSAPPPLQAAVHRAERPIAGRYIVVLRSDARPTDLSGFELERGAPEVARELARRHGVFADRTFSTSLSGFRFVGSAQAAETLSRDPRVDYVAEDGWATIAAQQSPTPSWGLDRIDQPGAALDNSYTYMTDGTGIDLYVVDTGVRSTHQEFGARVDTVNAFSIVADDLGTEDCHGHGTLVAGIAAGETFGVAKGATIHPVRVLDCYGQGAISNIITAIDWITARYPLPTNKRKPLAPTRAVVNMSLDAGYSQPLEQAIATSIAHGITYVVAAGNNANDACYTSPARVPDAITVAAVESNDARWASSNFGPCVDLFAPGRLVTSSFIRSDTDTVAFTGTSAAAPHVAGTAALMLSANPNAMPKDVVATLRAAATQGAVVDAGEGSPNLLLYSAFAGSGADYPPAAEFNYSCSGSRCSFDAGRSGDDWGILDYSWDFGDGRGGRGASPDHRYREATSTGIVVTLTVTDTSGQTATYQRALDGAW